MSLSSVCSTLKGSVTRQPAFAARAKPTARTARLTVTAHHQGKLMALHHGVAYISLADGVTRRDIAVLGLCSVASTLQAGPAKAFLGFGEDSETKYVNETTSIINDVRTVLSLDREDPTYDDAVKKVRKETNDWVAKYRRDNSFSGRPSFGNTYSALNALAGHYNSFGTNAPIPRKRLDRIEKELGDAEKLLQRGR